MNKVAGLDASGARIAWSCSNQLQTLDDVATHGWLDAGLGQHPRIPAAPVACSKPVMVQRDVWVCYGAFINGQPY